MALSVEGLRLIQAIASRGSLSLAAQELGYTQSAASRQLVKLERAAGRQLVSRTPRGASLTAAGAELLPHAVTAIEAVESAERAARGKPTLPPLRVGAFASAGVGLLPGALLSMSVSDPALVIRTTTATSPTLIRAVQSGRLDAALVVTRPPFSPVTGGLDRMVELEIGMIELRVAVGESHQLASNEALRVGDLGDAVWIGPVSPAGDPTLGVWPSLRATPKVRYRTDDWLSKLQLVAAGLAITTVPQILAHELPAGIRLLEVADVPAERRRIVLITSRSASDRCSSFVATLRAVFADLAEDD